MTEVKKCTCKNEYQDKKYGEGMRVKNSTKGFDETREESSIAYRCTVCGK